MTNKHFEELIEQIRKEKDINCLIKSFDDFNLHFSCKPDRKIYPYPTIMMLLMKIKQLNGIEKKLRD